MDIYIYIYIYIFVDTTPPGPSVTVEPAYCSKVAWTRFRNLLAGQLLEVLVELRNASSGSLGFGKGEGFLLGLATS